VNEELRGLFEQDQADRRAGPVDAGVQERDRRRRQRLEELRAAGVLRTAEDHYHAAMLLQHGETLADAGRAAALGSAPARWLAAGDGSLRPAAGGAPGLP
jgi:hypothetical protein